MPVPETKATAKAAILVGWWLKGEHPYQFGRKRPSLGSDPHANLDAIMKVKIPEQWSLFQSCRAGYQENPDDKLYLQADKHLLRATAAARAAVVWNGVAIGTNFLRANRASFNLFSQEFMRNRAGSPDLPDAALLDKPLTEAIAPASLTPIEGSYAPLPVYLAVAGLAITHLREQQEQTGSMLLPRPGTPAGDVQPWSNR